MDFGGLEGPEKAFEGLWKGLRGLRITLQGMKQAESAKFKCRDQVQAKVSHN